MEKQNIPPKTDTFSDSIREFELPTRSVSDAPVHQPITDVSTPNELDESPVHGLHDDWSGVPRSGFPWRKAASFSALVFAAVCGLILLSHYGGSNTPTSVNMGLSATSAKLKSQSTSLPSLSNQLSSAPPQSTGTLTVNGNVSIGNSLLLQPITKPSNPNSGQLYYDKGTNLMEYYDGKGFVTVGSSPVTNNYTTVGGAVTNVTKLTQVTNDISGGGVSGSNGTSGTLAMFGESNTLQDSLIKQSGSTLTASADTFQGSNSQGLSVLTTDSAGATGALTLQSGASSTTSSGDVTLDTGSGIVNGTVIDDYTFESGVDGWDGTPYFTNPVQSNAFAHSGSDSLALPLSLVSWSAASIEGLTVVPGHEYQWSAWLRAGTASAPIAVIVYYVNGNNPQPPAVATSDSVGSWTHYTENFVVPNGTTTTNLTFVYQKNATESHYIDDVTLTDLNSFSGLTVNVGTTNAQAVNIGNANQVGDTTITGGTTGVKINDATGNVDINSGAEALITGSKVVLSNTGGNGNGVFVEPENDSTTAFQVQNANGNATLFDVDTSNSAVNIATDGLETANLGSITATMGYTSVGNVQDQGDMNLISGGQYTAPATGTIGSLSAFIGPAVDGSPNNQMQMAIYSDNGSGAPGDYLASTAVTTVIPNSWITLPININVIAGTKYWLVRWSNSSNNNDNATMHTVLNQTYNYAYTLGVTFGSGPDNGMPAVFPAPSFDGPRNTFQSYYASYTTATGPAVSIDSTGTLNDYGPVIFKEATNSATAFTIQDSSGTPLFTADTNGMGISIGGTLTVSGDITLDGHIITSGNTPAITAGTAACTSPTVNVSGSDTAGQITVTTGTGCSASGTLANVTFANSFAATPYVVISPIGGSAASLNGYVDSASLSDNGFSVDASTTPANSTTYTWDYWVAQ